MRGIDYSRIIGGLLGVLFLAGCASEGMEAVNDAPRFKLARNGLSVPSAGQEISFGRTQQSTIASVTKLLGTSPSSVTVNPDCGAGPLTIATWASGLDLLFLASDFRGWTVTERQFATDTALSVGTPLSTLQARQIPISQTSLGPEFEAGGIFGLVEGNLASSTVTALWAGTTCFFR